MVRKVLIRDDEESPVQSYEQPDRLAVADSITGALSEVIVQASEDNGQASATTTVIDAVDAGATLSGTATTAAGAALVSHRAVVTAAGGTATARLDAVAAGSGSGVAEARVASGMGASAAVGIVARFTPDTGGELVVIDGNGAEGDPGDILTASATVGSEWLPPMNPIIAAGAIVVSANGGNTLLTLGVDGSFSFVGNGGIELTMAADGSFGVNGSGVVKLLGLPSADPEVAGQLYTVGAPSAGIGAALMVSGGPP